MIPRWDDPLISYISCGRPPFFGKASPQALTWRNEPGRRQKEAAAEARRARHEAERSAEMVRPLERHGDLTENLGEMA